MLLVLVAAIAHWITPLGGLSIYSSPGVGAISIIAGFAIMIWAWWQFRKKRVAICPTSKTDRLITDGIYRLTRNPMYLGITLMLLGIAIWSGSLPFYAAAIGFNTIIHHAFCPYEEAKLKAAFGDEYERYASRVRRWI
jgi:protein-S-isoprenylcysteine O-methyltransferase Ste14